MPKLVSTRDLKHRVEVGTFSSDTGYSGGPRTFASKFPIRCGVETKTPGVANTSSSEHHINKITLKCRFNPKLRTDQFIKFKSSFYEIVSIENIEQLDHTLVLELSEFSHD